MKKNYLPCHYLLEFEVSGKIGRLIFVAHFWHNQKNAPVRPGDFPNRYASVSEHITQTTPTTDAITPTIHQSTATNFHIVFGCHSHRTAKPSLKAMAETTSSVDRRNLVLIVTIPSLIVVGAKRCAPVKRVTLKRYAQYRISSHKSASTDLHLS
jgi:hypothetical protein